MLEVTSTRRKVGGGLGGLRRSRDGRSRRTRVEEDESVFFVATLTGDEEH